MTVRKTYARLLVVLWASDLLAVRLMLSVSAVFWSGFLFWPGSTFDDPAYTIMADVMGESAWATLFLATGLMQGTVLLVGCYHSKLCVLFAAIQAGLWLFTPIALALSGFLSASISGNCALALAAVWVYLRSGYMTAGESYGRGALKRA